MQKEYQIIADIITSGGIGVFPTDTLYGLICRALDKNAVQRVFTVRKRDGNKPPIILISSYKDLNIFNIKLNNFQKKFLKKVWPNKISVILPTKNKKWSYLHKNSGGLAFRMPKDKELLELLKLTGPLIAPSANLQGKSPAKNLNEAKKYFNNKVDFYYCPKILQAQASTLVKLENSDFQILRQGDFKI